MGLAAKNKVTNTATACIAFMGKPAAYTATIVCGVIEDVIQNSVLVSRTGPAMSMMKAAPAKLIRTRAFSDQV